MNIITSSKTKVTNSPPCGVSIPQKITKRDAVLFGALLAKCRKSDIQRRMKQSKDVRTDPEVRAITAFCAKALEDVKAIWMMKEAE